MKRIFCCFMIALFCWTAGSAQSGNRDIFMTDSIHQKVVQLYNQGDPEAIYNLSNASFRNFISHDDFVHWLQEVQIRYGKIESSSYAGYADGFATYTTLCERGQMDLLLAVDPFAKISGFSLRPFKTQLAKSDNPLSGKIDSLVDKAIHPYIQQGNTAGVSIGVIANGHIYTYGYGETAKDNKQLPNANTLYEIGSLTKTFTATLLASFVLQGKCKLDDPVNKYLPATVPLLRKDGATVTLKMLANHTSGLPRIPSDLFSLNSSPDDPYKAYDTTRLYHYLDTVALRTTPGLQLEYSNLGFGLLGTILARMAGESYDSLLQTYICSRLNMKSTRTDLNSAQQRLLATGYLDNGQPAHYWNFSALTGCGGIKSSVNDMLKYLKAHLQPDTKTVLGKAIELTEQTTYTANNTRIGLGWFSLNGVANTHWHNGGTGGFRSYAAYNPSKNVAIVILSNSTISVDDAGEKLIHALLQLN